MKPIKVVHIITRLIVGGAQENTVLSCALIDPSRFPSLIIVGPQTGSEGELFTEARARGIEIIVEPSLVREVHPLKDAWSVPRLVMHLKGLRPDIVHTHSSKAGIVGRVAARLAGVPRVVHTIHGWGFRPRQAWQERSLYQTLERWCAPLADILVVVAACNREQGKELRIGREAQYRVIRSGIEVEVYAAGRERRDAVRAELGLGPREFLFGSVGRLSPQKSPLDLMAAFERVAVQFPHAHLLLVGDGPLRAAVEGAVRDRGLAARVHMVGLRRDVPGFLGAMDAFVLASRWEGLPRVVPQALAARLPVVATSTDGTPEAVHHGETGFLVEPGDVSALAERMIEIVRDPARAKAMGEAGARLVDEFSARRMVDQLAELYSELAREGGASGPRT